MNQKDLNNLILLERYRNEGTRTYSQHAAYTEAKPQYQPLSGDDSFELPCFQITTDQLNIYLANPDPQLQQIYLNNNQALFCIHPQIVSDYPSDVYLKQVTEHGTAVEPLTVSPTASTRTLLVRSLLPDHALKVHFPFRVSRYHRKMRDEVIEQAVNVSRELENGIQYMDERFAFLREVIGVAYRNLTPENPRGENWGYLVRDMRPYPPANQKSQLIPGFALYGQDSQSSTPGRPLLFELISEADPCGDILENIMLPIVRHWISCFLNFGYLLEPHAQNTLFEIDEGNNIKRIVHRDLSVGIDMRRRQLLGLPDDALNQYNRMQSGEFHSIVYDEFMGHHFFQRIVEICLKAYPNLVADDFQRPCRDEFERLFPEHREYFPATVYYFSEQRDMFGKPLYQNTGRIPLWRPV